MLTRLKSSTRLAALAAGLLMSLGTHAASIEAAFMNVTGNTWDVSFTVAASAGQSIDAFSVYFDWAKVSNLLVQASPAGWDALAFQADNSPSDGIFDALALGAGITSGTSLGGFTARFDWVDLTGPTALRYTVNDPVTFQALETGATANPIPEPSTWILMGFGLVALFTLVRTRDA